MLLISRSGSPLQLRAINFHMAATKRIQEALSDGLFKTQSELIDLLYAAFTIRNAQLFQEVGHRLLLEATSTICQHHPRISLILCKYHRRSSSLTLF